MRMADSYRMPGRRGGPMAPARAQAGASFLIALFFALICALVAVLVLSAAATNAERTGAHVRDEQGYFSVASALELGESLVQRDLCAEDFTIPATLTAENVAGVKAGLTTANDPLGLRAWAVEALFKKRANPAQAVAKYLVVTAADLGESNVELPDVLLVFTIEDVGGHIAVRACQNVWNAAQIAGLDLSDAAGMQQALVDGAERGDVTYANVLQKNLWRGGTGVDLATTGSTSAWVMVGGKSEEAGS